MFAMHDPLAMIPVPATSSPLVMQYCTGPSMAPGFLVSTMIAIALFLGGSPILSMCVLTASALSSFVVGPLLASHSRGKSRPVRPEAIASIELRTTYRSILLELAEIECSLAEAPRLKPLMATALEQARGAVASSGQLAVLGNPLQRYFDKHDQRLVGAELQRLRERIDTTTDEAALAVWGQAAAARTRQLAIHDEMMAQRDRLHARLELVRAGLETFSATIAKLHALDDEQIALAGEPATEQIERLGEELAALESALAVDAAA